MPDVLVFRRVRAVDPARGLDAEIDVVVEKKLITRAGPRAADEILKTIAPDRVRVFETPGALLLPGLVDLHSHVREPGQTHKEDIASGLAAAAAGGFTDICAMPNTSPINDSRGITELLVYKARAVGGTRLHPIAAITVGQKGDQITEMADLKEAGAVAVSDDGRCVTRSDVMRRALEYASTFDLPVIQHAEDHALTDGAQMHEGGVSTRLGLRGWPRIAEDVIVARDVLLAEYVGAKYHVAHVSTLGSARILREAKSRGIAVTAEVTPHHLLLTDQKLIGYDTACKVNPPLRETEDLVALREALADGTVDVIATDHAPHAKSDKEATIDEAAPGMIGLELCLPLMLGLVEKGILPLGRVIDALTRAPAKIIGIDAPSILEGVAANLTFVDPNRTWTVDPARLRTKSSNTPFLGHTMKGMVLATLVSGTVAFDAANESSRER